jgi:hypothetical protein
MIPFAKTGDAGTTLSHAVIPAGGRDRVRIQYINATSDKAASLLGLPGERHAAAGGVFDEERHPQGRVQDVNEFRGA